MRSLFIFSCLFYLLLSNPLAAQRLLDKPDQLATQMYLHRLAKPSATLFVHFDKNVYTNNEEVWFTGYLTEEGDSKILRHQLLSVSLIRNADSSIIKSATFLINSGLSFGNMVLPDSMQTGDYHFLASTNMVNKGKPDAVFIQPITIKTNIDPPFSARIKLLEPGIEGKKPNQVLVSATTTDARFLSAPVDITYRYGKETKKAKTSKSGELVLSINEQSGISDPNVYVKLKYGKDSSSVNLALPITKRKARVNFYPEGGNLVNGLISCVAWEVKDQENAVVSLKAQLYKNDEVIDTIETGPQGIGKFILETEKGSSYKVKLLHTGFADSIYRLPAALDTGIVLAIRNPLAGDTLTILLSNSHHQKLNIYLHNFEEIFLYQNMEMKAGQKNLKMALTDVPVGLKTITIADSLGRPLAERMVFPHYNPSQKIAISSGQAEYGLRQKVTLKLKLTGRDSIGLVSVACVQDNRLSQKWNTDIESYIYLNKELSELPLSSSQGRAFEDKDYMQNILMVKGWRRYTWRDIVQTRIVDTLKSYDSIAYTLDVAKKDKPLTAAVNIGLLSNKGIAFMATDEHGHANFKIEDLLTEPGKKVVGFVGGGKDQLLYSFKVVDPFEKLNKSYLKLFKPEGIPVPSTVENNTVMLLKSNEKAIRLKEVNISLRKGNEIKGPPGANGCGDYVCLYNILNCRNHVGDIGNTQPIVGHRYTVSGGYGGQQIYKKCEQEGNKAINVMPAIYARKEFYKDTFSDPLEPAYFSTIYWNYAILLRSSTETEVSFYTSDIAGKFRVIAQGMSNKEMLYGTSTFEVRNK